MLKQVVKFITDEINHIEERPQFNQKRVGIEVNPALALTQVSLSSRHKALKDVLEQLKEEVKA